MNNKYFGLYASVWSYASSVWNRTIEAIGTIGTIGFKKTEKLSDQKPSDSRSDSPIDRKPKMFKILFKRFFHVTYWGVF